MEAQIDLFIRFLATERGLSDNYQLSTRRSLSEFAAWCAKTREITAPAQVTMPLISDYLAARKRDGLAAASIKLVVVALKIFFRFLLAKGRIERDPTETLTLPRIERYLPETLNELQVQQLIESINTTQPLGLRDRAIIELLYASGLPDLGAGERAAGELQRRAADPARDGQREQDAAGAGGTESVRSAGGVRLGGTTEAGERQNRERDFPLLARDEAHDGAAFGRS
jgi:integrase